MIIIIMLLYAQTSPKGQNLAFDWVDQDSATTKRDGSQCSAGWPARQRLSFTRRLALVAQNEPPLDNVYFGTAAWESAGKLQKIPRLVQKRQWSGFGLILR